MNATKTAKSSSNTAAIPRVVIEVRHGFTYVYTDGDVSLLTLDYDVDGVDDNETGVDAAAERCFVHREAIRDRRLVERTFRHFTV